MWAEEDESQDRLYSTENSLKIAIKHGVRLALAKHEKGLSYQHVSLSNSYHHQI